MLFRLILVWYNDFSLNLYMENKCSSTTKRCVVFFFPFLKQDFGHLPESRHVRCWSLLCSLVLFYSIHIVVSLICRLSEATLFQKYGHQEAGQWYQDNVPLKCLAYSISCRDNNEQSVNLPALCCLFFFFFNSALMGFSSLIDIWGYEAICIYVATWHELYCYSWAQGQRRWCGGT